MARIEILKKKIDNYLRKEQLLQNQDHVKLEKLYLEKSRKNLAVATLLFTISEQEEIKKLIPLPADFETYDWVMVIYYYAMYMAGLAALAKLGFKSSSHAATITILEYYYTQKPRKLLTPVVEMNRQEFQSSGFLVSQKLLRKPIKPPFRVGVAASLIIFHDVHAQKNLDQKYLQQLNKAYLLSENLISKLMQTKTKRETAQYNATPNISKEMAIDARENAEEFISRIEEILAVGFFALTNEKEKTPT